MDLKVEQRAAARVEAEYRVEYSVPGKGSDGVGLAVDLSENGLRFVTGNSIAPGSHLRVRVPPRASGLPALLRLASVVRCLRLEDGSGYVVGCVYD
jgi:hypothetical protein